MSSDVIPSAQAYLSQDPKVYNLPSKSIERRLVKESKLTLYDGARAHLVLRGDDELYFRIYCLQMATDSVSICERQLGHELA